jgi:dienelactone hydrolase
MMTDFNSRPAASRHPRFPARNGGLLPRWLRPTLAGLVGLALLIAVSASGQQPVTLPETAPLTWREEPSARMLGDLDRFLTRALERAPAARDARWQPDFTSVAAYARSLAAHRERLRKIIGAVDTRLPVGALEFVGSTASPAKVADTGTFTVYAVRWPVFEGVFGEGLWLHPKTSVKARVVAIPDADQTPEQVAGLAPGLAAERQFARRLAEHGCDVLVPVLVNRDCEWSGDDAIGRVTNQPHREWIYRQAFPLGRHIIGYEVQKTLAALDALAGTPPSGDANAGAASGAGRLPERQRPIAATESAQAPPSDDADRIPLGVVGYGEGGLIAFYAAALDERVAATLVSGYFDSREALWAEPVYRNLFGLLREFGDAEIAMLIAPRALIVEHAPAPNVPGPPPPRDGKNTAAPGRISTPDYASVEAEFERARKRVCQGALEQFQGFTLISGAEGMTTGPMSDRALTALLRALGQPLESVRPPGEAPGDLRPGFDPSERQRRAVRELVAHTQRLLRGAERERTKFFWARLQTDSLTNFVASTRPLREFLSAEVLGAFTNAPGPMNPRSRCFAKENRWSGYEIALDVFPDVSVYGLLLQPNDLQPGERRPVVLCLHGLEGTPFDLINTNADSAAFRLYRALAARLAERGLVVFAPQLPCRGGEAFRRLQRKAQPLGHTLFGLVAAQQERALEWLASLPFVDAERIGLYGFSYGGNAVMHLAPVLERCAAAICSGSFNEWARKTAATEEPRSFLFVPEYEVFEFNLANTFSHAELAALIAPRPFMVERGRNDPVAADEWVAYEFAKVRRLYEQLGIGERAEIEFFGGGHQIHGDGTFRFLERHLRRAAPGF